MTVQNSPVNHSYVRSTVPVSGSSPRTMNATSPADARITVTPAYQRWALHVHLVANRQLAFVEEAVGKVRDVTNRQLQQPPCNCASDDGQDADERSAERPCRNHEDEQQRGPYDECDAGSLRPKRREAVVTHQSFDIGFDGLL